MLIDLQAETAESSQLHGMNPQREHLESLISDLKGQMRRNRLKYDNDDKIIMRVSRFSYSHKFKGSNVKSLESFLTPVLVFLFIND